MLSFFIVYLIDCNLNFPTYRPVSHINFILISSLVYVVYKKELKSKKKEDLIIQLI